MVEPGHVFVVHGDLTKLACDYYLLPTGSGKRMRPEWERFGALPEVLPDGWGPHGVRITSKKTIHVQSSATDDQPVEVSVRWVNTGGIAGRDSVQWLRDGVAAGLRQARDDLHPVRSWRNGRARALIGIPVFGTGEGGFSEVRGDVLSALLRVAQEAVTDSGLDIVIVCHRRSDFTAVQSCPDRSAVSWPTLTPEQWDTAGHLSEHAANRSLVLFLGAGVSIPAGLPSWDELIKKLSDESKDVCRKDVEAVDPLDAATVLFKSLGEEKFLRVLEGMLRRDEYALSHALLASLRVAEAVTTNFDTLYEDAARPVFNPERLRVLPWDRAVPATPWLLKLHGGIGRKHVILKRDDFSTFDERWRPLGSMVQALMMTRHVLFVGFSMKDENFSRLAVEVQDLLSNATADHAAGHHSELLGTVLTLRADPEMQENWGTDLRVLAASQRDNASDADAGRDLEIFLDLVAAKAAASERSYLLDPTYLSLVPDEHKSLATELANIAARVAQAGPDWQTLAVAMREHGSR